MMVSFISNKSVAQARRAIRSTELELEVHYYHRDVPVIIPSVPNKDFVLSILALLQARVLVVV